MSLYAYVDRYIIYIYIHIALLGMFIVLTLDIQKREKNTQNHIFYRQPSAVDRSSILGFPVISGLISMPST